MPRPLEPRQCILRCDNTFRSFSSCFMASTHRAPKQWCLSKVETINSFENWKQNLLYTLSLDSNFAPFLGDGVTWLKKKQSPTAPRTRKRWRSRPTQSTPNRSSESQLSRAHAWPNRQLLPHYFRQHPGEKLNLPRVHLANYSTTLWIPGHRRTIY